MSEKKTVGQSEKLAEKGVVNFVGEIKSEFKKITWTSREELQAYTKIVVGATFAFGIGVYFMDLIIQTSLDSLAVVLKILSG